MSPIDLDLAEFVDKGRCTPKPARNWSRESYRTEHYSEWFPMRSLRDVLDDEEFDPMRCDCDGCRGIQRAAARRRR